MAPHPKRLGQALPAFDRPPVTEVIIGLAFEPIPTLTGAMVGRIFPDYQVNSEQPLYMPLAERFGPSSGLPQIGIQLLPTPPGARQWLASEGGAHLLQVQRDWMGQNWRRQSADEVYPHFDEVRAALCRNWGQFTTYLSLHDMGSPRVTQCEVTYVNAINPGGMWSSFGDLDRVFTVARRRAAHAFLPRPDDETIQLRYSIPAQGRDEPAGRLHVSIQPALRQPGPEAIFVMTLTARGVPLSQSDPGPFLFLDIAHEWIVRGFVDLTTARMHEVWGRSA